MGKRLKEILSHKPKGMLQIAGKEIIKESLDLLAKNGIKNIILVTGYQSDQYRHLLGAEYPSIQYVINPDYQTTGSMHSLFLAKTVIAEDFLLLESDLLYEDRCLSSLLDLKKSDVILLSGSTESGDEVFVYGTANKIELISKKKDNNHELQGELVGISRISRQLYAEMCAYYHQEITTHSDFHYEDCLSDLCGKYDIYYHKEEDIIWTEIDDPYHYERAVNIIYPKIRQKRRELNRSPE